MTFDMQRLLTVIFVCCLLTLPAWSQVTSLWIDDAGRSHLTVQNPHEGQSQEHILSPKATASLFAVVLEQHALAESQGKRAFYHPVYDVIAYAGGEAGQIAALQQKEQNAFKKLSDDYYAVLDRLVRFDELSPEEVATMENGMRAAMQREFEAGDAAYREVLTPEQLQRAKELQLVLPAFPFNQDFSPFINFDAYNALSLSEEQQKQLDAIRREAEPEMKVFASEINELFLDGFRRRPKPELYLKALATINKAKAFKARTKARILALLTSEQTAKYEKLLKELPAELKRRQAEWWARQKARESDDDSWKESWKPGDPVPDGAAPPQEKPRLFPFGK